MMPERIQILFSIVLTSDVGKVVTNNALGHGYKWKANVARIDAPFDFHDALPDSQTVQKEFLSLLKKECTLRGENVFCVLEPEVDLCIAVAQDVNGYGGGMLRDTH